MKKVVIILIFLLTMSSVLLSQEVFTGRQDTSKPVGLYIEMGITKGTMIRSNALMLNVNGGFVYKQFYLGGFGISLINDIQTPTDTLHYFVDMGFGGLHIGYDFFKYDESFSLLTGIELGMGTISVSSLSTDATGSRYLKLIRNANAVLLIPSVEVGYKIFDNISINIMCNYTYIFGYQDGMDIKSGYFNSFSYGVGLKLEM